MRGVFFAQRTTITYSGRTSSAAPPARSASLSLTARCTVLYSASLSRKLIARRCPTRRAATARPRVCLVHLGRGGVREGLAPTAEERGAAALARPPQSRRAFSSRLPQFFCWRLRGGRQGEQQHEQRRGRCLLGPGVRRAARSVCRMVQDQAAARGDTGPPSPAAKMWRGLRAERARGRPPRPRAAPATCGGCG